MKSKASLVLMEQLVMILVFALCAALCLQAFVGADRISQETARRDEAVLLAQNTAESLKAGRPIPTHSEELSLQVTALPSGIPGMEKAEISVFDAATQTLLVSLTVGYQEVG